MGSSVRRHWHVGWSARRLSMRHVMIGQLGWARARDDSGMNRKPRFLLNVSLKPRKLRVVAC